MKNEMTDEELIARLHESHFGTHEQRNLARRLGEEKARAALTAWENRNG